MSHRNIRVNIEQIVAGYFGDHGGIAPEGTTVVSWAPLFHDMGLMTGVVFPILGGIRSVLTSPASFLQRPARW
ncbi:AMP-binding protein, partial [Klebsiella pneumoniae]